MGLFYRLEKGIILYSEVKAYHCVEFTDFQFTKSYISVSRYSEIYSYKKERRY